MEMRIVVPDAASASALAERLTIVLARSASRSWATATEETGSLASSRGAERKEHDERR